jgi:uncharacterized heparinase superfamily protein
VTVPPRSSLRWYRGRLAAMSGRERAWRLVAPARAAAELVPRRSKTPRFDSGPWPSSIVDLAAGVRATAADDAARIVAGERFFWGRSVTFDPATPEWTRDSFADRAARDGDRKLGWEVHRQQHLFPLATGGLGQAAVLSEIDGWIAGNPRAKRGLGWSSSFETAHRLVQWAWAVPLVAATADGAELTAISRSYTQQARFVAARPSRHSSANNHRITEIVGLLHAAAITGDAAAWAALWAELETHARAQAYADGGSREQAAGYFLYVLETLWVAGVLARSLGRELLGLREQLERRVDWAVAAGDEDLEPPPFGDDSEDRIIRIDYFQPRRARDIVGRVSALLDDRLVLEPAESIEPAADSRALESGIVVLRSGDPATVRISVDVGELGFGTLAAHGHADALSVMVDGGGTPILRDSGTGSYQQSEGRELLRSTAAHNTVEIRGTSQAEPLGPHLWGRRYAITVEQTALTESHDYVRARHDGYVRQFGAVHTRSVLFLKPHLLLVTDCVTAEAPQDVALHWHLMPGAEPASLGGGASLVVVADSDADVADGPWPYSPAYKHWADAPRWSWRVRAREVRFVSLIALRQGRYDLRLAAGVGGDEITIDGPVSARVIERWEGIPAVELRA